MLEAFVTPGWSLFEKSKWFREAGLETGTIKRLVLIECRKNLAILNTLSLNDNSLSQTEEVFVTVARRIEYSAIEMLIASDDKANKTLNELHKLEMRHEKDELDLESRDKSNNEKKVISVGERLIRLYVRMYSLRILGQIWSEQSGTRTGIRKIYFRTRLKNLQDALISIEKSLSNKAS